MKIAIHWFRRDLRLEDNTALTAALNSGLPVLPVFIFDENIIGELPVNDPRIDFIYSSLKKVDSQLKKHGSGIKILKGAPEEAWGQLIKNYDISKVFYNKDYEPYARERDENIGSLLGQKDILFSGFKDQVIFEENEVLKPDGKPYSVFTPYKRKWLSQFSSDLAAFQPGPGYDKFYPFKESFPELTEIGFEKSSITVRDYDLSNLRNYSITRELPAEDGTSFLGPHLRFGTVSIRKIVGSLKLRDDIFLGELIWREFFMQILFHYPRVVDQNFRKKYDGIPWRNREDEFEKWCLGKTGYPFIDAGMRQLNQTGFMHNRVRMATASFLVKHLLIDWRWGEAYFAEKLLDYELSSNNGNWQWAAGTGCDAAPYFRVFNPITQQLKFDKDMVYIRKWIQEYDTPDYPEPMVEHSMARTRALEAYKMSL